MVGKKGWCVYFNQDFLFNAVSVGAFGYCCQIKKVQD